MTEEARGRSGLIALVALLAFAALLGAPPALAAGEHPYLAASHLEGLAEPCGVATDSRGDLYVAEAEGRILVYDPAGAPLTEFQPGEISPAFTHCGIAVDRSGAVYVAGFGIPREQQVVKYRPVGGEYPPTSSTEYELDESAGDEGVFVDELANAVAVDPETGDVYVAEEGTSEVQRLAVPPAAQCTPGTKLVFAWTPTGEVGTIEVDCGANEGPIRSALEDLLGAGTVEVLPGESVPNTYRVRFAGELRNTDFPVGALETREAGSGAVRSTSTAQPNVNGAPSRISIYEPDGTPLPGAIGTGVGGAAYYGVDVDAGSGRVFAVDVQNVLVDVFDPSVSRSAPSATIDGSDNPSFPGGFGDLTQGFVAVDQTTGSFFVNNVGYSFFDHQNEGNGVIAQFTSGGEFVSQIGPTFGDEELEFESEIYWPIGLAVDDGPCSPNRGNVYVAANWESVYAFGPTSPFTPAAPAVTTVQPSAGPTAGGNAVTVTGTELGCADLPGGAVELGGAAATDVEVNAAGTALTATAPAHAAGTVDVTVTTGSGTSTPGAGSRYAYVSPLTLAVGTAGSGSGSVECDGGPCQGTYPYGSSVALEARAAAGSSFDGWSGACAGGGECVVTVTAATAVTATFTANATSPPADSPTPAPPGPAALAPAGKRPTGAVRLPGNAKVSGGVAAVRLSCAGPVTCSGVLRLRMKVKKGGRFHRVTVGSVRFALAGGTAKRVRVELSARAKRRLAKGRLRVRVTAPSLSRTLTLRPRR